MDNSIRRGSFEMTAAMLISGTIGWFVLVSGQPVLDVVFWRCLFGAGALLLICAAFGFLRPGILTRTTFLLAVLSGVAIVGNWVLLFASYSRASIAIGTAVYNVQPFMLVGLAAIFLNEKITLQKLAWLGVSFLGMLAIVSAHGGEGESGNEYLIGIVLALGAAFLYAIAALIIKRLTGTPPHLIALVQVGLLVQSSGTSSVLVMAWLLFAFFCGFNVLEATQPSMASRMAPPAVRGTALGVYNTLQSLGFFVGGWLGGWLVKTWGSPALFACCAVAMLVWCLVALPMQTPGRAAPVQLAE